MTVQTTARLPARPGETCWFAAEPVHLHLFDPGTGARIDP